MYLKLGDLYVKSINIDSYDNEIRIEFTNFINEAKEFDSLNKRLIESCLLCTLSEVQPEKAKESE